MRIEGLPGCFALKHPENPAANRLLKDKPVYA